MSNATKSLSKSEMEKVKAASENDNSTADITDLKNQIKAVISKLSPVEKQAAQAKLKENNLPTAFAKVTSAETLLQILSLITE